MPGDTPKPSGGRRRRNEPVATGNASSPLRAWDFDVTRERPGVRRPGRMMLATTFAILLMLPVAHTVGKSSWAKPGPLSSAHARILSDRSSGDRCQSCHQSSAASDDDAAAKLTMSDRCRVCHPAGENDYALTIHNLNPSNLVAATSRMADWSETQSRRHHQSLPRPQGCPVCHREHHGDDRDLTALTDRQCQSCHVQSFDGFASGHPPFGDRYGLAGANVIAFTHRRHAAIHFPNRRDGGSTTMQCQSCHRPDATGNYTTAVDYQQSCAGCHDDALRLTQQPAFTLLTLPTLSPEQAELFANWPTYATGLPDVVATPEGDTIRQFEPVLNATNIDIAAAIIGWFTRYANGDGDIAGLSPQLVADTYDRWFVNDVNEETPKPDSGWVRDDVNMSIVYAGSGHADPAVTQWLETTRRTGTLDERHSLAATCVACHEGFATSGRWADHSRTAAPLTYFDHKPHAQDARSKRCQSCHAFAESDASFASNDGVANILPADNLPADNVVADNLPANNLAIDRMAVSDFAAVTIDQCASCHNATGASQSCVTCHRYHGWDASYGSSP